MCRAVAGSTCRWGTRRGLAGWSPADRAIPESTGACLWVTRRPDFSFDFAPIPDPLPDGKGETNVFMQRGSAPCIPELNPARHGKKRANHTPGRGLAFLVACQP